jgi:hypothetical protein
MFHISVLLMAILLILSTTPVSFAQQNPVQAQAKADADSDMSDMSKAMWVMLGGLGSTAGCLLGCVGGCAVGARLNPYGGSDILFIPAPEQAGCAAAGAILFGALAVPIGVHIYPHNAPPPPERLLGKSPEYIKGYTQIYKSKTASLRKTLVTKGSIAGNVGMVLATLLAHASID